MTVSELVRRSTLVIPATDKSLVGGAWNKKADAICLDLEDLVHPSKKADARASLKERVSTASGGGTDVLVRINRDSDLVDADLEAGVWPGLAGVLLPKVESAAEVHQVDKIITDLEKKRGIEAGTIKIGVLIETWRGNLDAYEIVCASPRVDTLCLGIVDLTTDELAIEVCRHIYLLERTIIIARVAGVQPQGTVGLHLSQAYKDVGAWRRGSILGHRVGFKGALTVHTGAVDAINEGFSFTAGGHKRKA